METPDIVLYYNPLRPYTIQYCPLLTHHHQVPNITTLNWPSSTKYQPVLSYADTVPSSINQCCLIMNQ